MTSRTCANGCSVISSARLLNGDSKNNPAGCIPLLANIANT